MNDKKKRRGPFDDDFGFFDEEFLGMSEMMDRLFNQAIREREDTDPIVYGFSVKTGPDGKPVFRRFGDSVRPGENISDGLSREPLTDIIERGDTVSVTIEIPGVEREEIDLDIDGKKMTVKVDNPNRRYHKVIELPCGVDEESVKATFRNGVLDITLTKIEKSKSRKIKID
jgi:HSP20 family protein